MSGKLKEVRERIGSVKSTMQITSAMKMVSAAKLKRATNAIVDMRPYSDRLNKMLINILSNLEGGANTSFGTARPIKKVGVVVITSNRGLCGGFNSSISKEAIKKIDESYKGLAESGDLTIYFIGKKGYDALKNRYPSANLNKDYIDIMSDLSFDNISKASSVFMNAFKDEKLDEIQVCYGQFKNAAVQIAKCVQFLPVEKLEPEQGEGSSKMKADYIFEPSKEVLLEQLIPSILQTSFFKYTLDNNASEHGARMTAMDKATENGGEILKDLKITYNKARQETITKEILEIVGGAAALEN